MPVIKRSSYTKPPFYQFNAHMQTILPAVLRNVRDVFYERERFILSDGDFVDLDWIDKGAKKLVLLAHGLEGNTERHYMKGMAKIFAKQNWDVLAWNCRSCSGEMNRKLRLYHHGEIEDIQEVIAHALQVKNYERMVLIGFSMGGNIIMKYLGVHGKDIPDPLYKAIAFSSPVDLKTSVELLNESRSSFYRNRFLKMLKVKMEIKARQFPTVIDFENFHKIEKWQDFDNFFTAPINGFKDAEDFYYQGSAKNFMSGTRIPTLLVNAINDPILSPACYPEELCEGHPYLFLESPVLGGHVGFSLPGKEFAWSEYRAMEFVRED